jgi:ankyrin repeat protein
MSKEIMNNDLIEACYYGQTEEVKRLLSEGAEVHYDNDYAFRRASMYNHLEVVKLLLENGADIKANDYEGLKMAEIFGHLDVVEYLNKWMLLDKLKGI